MQKPLKKKSDNLFNFCITHNAVRDWVFKEKQLTAGDSNANKSWRKRANEYFGECADLANSGKHCSIKKSATVLPTHEKMVMITPFGIFPENIQDLPSFEIQFENGMNVNLHTFLHLICYDWQCQFNADESLGDVGEWGCYLVQLSPVLRTEQ
ncbi:hypothetical protein [uncultured Deefgea sp.]|uniref:hypothetical protein n=1 Tax=uncultured Deefgea sp. TaxID=1304914 RepID=UPI0026139826|nr:hypothetical protein [uncultured Deefgea sp.]